MGEEEGKWDCGLTAKAASTIRNACERLRWKYMAKILGSPYNSKGEIVLDDADQYEKSKEKENQEKIAEKDRKKGKGLGIDLIGSGAV